MAAGDRPHPLRAMIASLGEILAVDGDLCIPPYQRAYGWRHTDVDRLLQDLRDAYSAARDYYFVGTVVLISDRPGAYDVVDGQQRLATFTLTLAALRDRLPSGEDLQFFIEREGAARLQLREADRGFVKDYVQRPGQFAALCALAQDEIASGRSQAQLIEAAQTIGEFLDNADLDLKAFADFLLNATLFNVIDTIDRAGAPQMFTTLNDTGLELSTVDFVKTEMLQRAALDPVQAEAAARDWDAKVDLLGRRGMDALFKALPSVLGRALYGEAATARDLREAFHRTDPRAFLTTGLDRYVKAYQAIESCAAEMGPHSDEVNRRLRCLKLLPDKSWAPAALWAIAEVGQDASFVRDYLVGLERFAFACAVAAVEAGVRTDRLRKIMQAGRDRAALFGGDGAFALRPKERETLLNKVSVLAKRDHKRRRLVAFRVNAALGEPLDHEADDATVEHILPVRANGAWVNAFPDAAGANEHANRLGNLTLVTHRQNVRAADRPFPEKREIYFGGGAPVFAIMRSVEPETAWTPEQVRARGQTLLEALARDWDLTL